MGAYHLTYPRGSENFSNYVLLATESTHLVWVQGLCTQPSLYPGRPLELRVSLKDASGTSTAERCSVFCFEIRWPAGLQDYMARLSIFPLFS